MYGHNSFKYETVNTKVQLITMYQFYQTLVNILKRATNHHALKNYDYAINNCILINLI